MNGLPRLLLLVLAAVSLGGLGWDAWQPRSELPVPVPPPSPAPGSPSPRVPNATPQPHFTHLTADRLLRPGRRLTVHGRVRGLTLASRTTLSMEGPDGTMASVELRGNETGEAPFSVEHPTPAPAPGTFSWKLRLHPSDDPVVLGVQVVEADRPRVLLLQDHPSVEAARLQRWLAEAGSPVTTRTRVSTDRYRVASSPGTGPALDRLAAPALESFDIVVAHAAALERLSPEENEALESTLRHDGLGLLILASHAPGPATASDAPQPPTPSPAPGAPGPSPSTPTSRSSPLVWPWLRASSPSAQVPPSPRETRVHLLNGVHLESAVSVLAVELAVPPGAHRLAQDPQGRPLVAARSLGRGHVACSIVLDTWRWRQHGRGDDHADFWSTLLSALARPRPASSGAWSMAEATSPAFVDHPISLVWSGAPDTPLPAAEIQSRGMPATPAVALNLHPSPLEPGQGHAAFWPEHPGWHTVRALPSGPTFDLYVHPAHALPGIRAQQDRDAARRAIDTASTPPEVDPVPPRGAGARPWIRLSAFLLFVFSAARLWHSDATTRSRQLTSPHPAPP